MRSTRPRLATQQECVWISGSCGTIAQGARYGGAPSRGVPKATHIAVLLKFEAPPHADQSFVLYPGARAYFGFPCPYGDCDGIYDLSHAAQSILLGTALQASGTLECSGVRSRHRIPRQTCGLQVSYIVNAQRLPSTAA